MIRRPDKTAAVPIALPGVQADQRLLWQKDRGGPALHVQDVDAPCRVSSGWLLVVDVAGAGAGGRTSRTGIFQADGQAGTAARLWAS